MSDDNVEKFPGKMKRRRRGASSLGLPDNLVELGPHTKMTPEQALEVTKREQPKEVLILYEDEDGDLRIRSSAMNNQRALWLAERLKAIALGLDPWLFWEGSDDEGA